LEVDDADVDLDRLGAADAVDLALLDGSEQLGLQAGIHFADFVEQQGTAIGFFELADTPGDGAGKGALLMTEQFRFQQVFRNGGAVHRDERLVVAQGFAMDIAGQHFLTRAAFAGHQDGGFAAGDLVGQAEHSTHGFVFINQLMGFVRHRRQHRGDQFRIGGKRQIFLGARANSRHGAACVGADAAGHDRSADALGRQPAHQGADIQAHIAEHQVGAHATAKRGQRLFDIRGMGDFRTLVHGDFGGQTDLALKSADDKETHRDYPSKNWFRSRTRP